MRRRDVTLGLGLFPAVLTNGATAAPPPSQEPPALRATLDRLLAKYTAAWKAGDGAVLAALYSPDVHWVNIVGMHWQGRADVDYAHRALFAGPFKGVSETLEKVESLTPLPGGGAVAVIRWAVGAYTSPAGHPIPASRTRMTLVLVPEGKDFLIAHGANIQIVEGAQRSDPVRLRDAKTPG